LKINDLKSQTLFEHRFWLQVLGDHSRFILGALSPEENSNIQKANYFKNLFDNLLNNARMDLSTEELNKLNNLAYNAACQIRSFKLYLIKEHLIGKIKINLPPTFINHMVNEVEEYLFILYCIMNKQPYLLNPVHYHKLWLLDGSGHAASIASSLDMAEQEFIKKSMKFRKSFDKLHQKSLEIKGYMRTGLFKFPALSKLNEDAEEEMNTFKKFLKDLEKLILEKKLLGDLKPLMTDHMYREECYYLTKLSMVSEVKKPGCAPEKPRIEE
jgi:hypothetical protein